MSDSTLKKTWRALAAHANALEAGTIVKVAPDLSHAYWATPTAVLKLPYEEEFGKGERAVLEGGKTHKSMTLSSLDPDRILKAGHLNLDEPCDWTTVVTAAPDHWWLTDDEGNVRQALEIPENSPFGRLPIKAWRLPDGIQATPEVFQKWEILWPKLRLSGKNDTLVLVLVSDDNDGSLLYLPMALQPDEWLAETGVKRSGITYRGQGLGEEGTYSKLSADIPADEPLDMVKEMGISEELALPPGVASAEDAPAEDTAEEGPKAPAPAEAPGSVPRLEDSIPKVSNVPEEARAQAPLEAPEQDPAEEAKEQAEPSQQDPAEEAREQAEPAQPKKRTRRKKVETVQQQVQSEAPSEEANQDVPNSGAMYDRMVQMLEDTSYVANMPKDVAREEMEGCARVAAEAVNRLLRISLATQKPDITQDDKRNLAELLAKIGLGNV